MIWICQDPTFTDGNSHEIKMNEPMGLSHTAMTIWNSGTGGLCPNDPNYVSWPKLRKAKYKSTGTISWSVYILGSIRSTMFIAFQISLGQKFFSSSLRCILLWHFAHPAFWESPTNIGRPHGPHMCWFWHVKWPEVLLLLLRLQSLQSFAICSMEFHELIWMKTLYAFNIVRHCDCTNAVKELQDFENQVDSTFKVDKCGWDA